MNADNMALYSPITVPEVLETISVSPSSAKSFDNNGLHPIMIQNMGTNAVYTLTKIFNLCLRNGMWIWNLSKVMFLKKEGKKTYSEAGSYRPISISSYISKVFEKILGKRLKNIFLKLVSLMKTRKDL